MSSEAVEILAQDDVGDASDRIGAVDGRCAVEQEVELPNEEARNKADVGADRRALDAGRGHAAAVDQYERAGSAQAAKTDFCGAGPLSST